MEIEIEVKMKIILFFLLLIPKVYAATCSSISRTNAMANSVLTSTLYNGELNTVYNQVNALDAGCLTDGTLEKAALNSTDFAVPLNGISQGCFVTNSDANTISVDKCILAVNGGWVRTSTPTTVTWGCSGCSSEATGSDYYLYAKTGSSGSTLNLLISTVAPSNDGYDTSSNKVLGKFYNDSAGSIATYSVQQFISSRMAPSYPVFSPYNFQSSFAFARVNNNGTASISDYGTNWISSVSRSTGGTVVYTLRNGVFRTNPTCVCGNIQASGECSIQLVSAASIEVRTYAAAGTLTDYDHTILCGGDNDP